MDRGPNVFPQSHSVIIIFSSQIYKFYPSLFLTQSLSLETNFVGPLPSIAILIEYLESKNWHTQVRVLKVLNADVSYNTRSTEYVLVFVISVIGIYLKFHRVFLKINQIFLFEAIHFNSDISSGV
jgi:hypothetical protein